MTANQLELKAFDSKWHLDSDTGCWNWHGAVQSSGYGNYRSRLAHRVSYENRVGKIPDGLTIDHKCRNRLCVNPKHLRIMTQKDNNLCGESPTAQNKRKTHCVNGHEFSEANTYLRKREGALRRVCRKCRNEQKRKKRNG